MHFHTRVIAAGVVLLMTWLSACSPQIRSTDRNGRVTVDKSNLNKTLEGFRANGRIKLRQGQAKLQKTRTKSGSIRLDQTVTGVLTATDSLMSDGSHYDTWAYAGRGGETIEVVLSSVDFDAYLYVVQDSPAGLAVLGEDDDSAGDLDARMLLTLPAAGEYLVIATSVTPAEGTYDLRLQAGEPMAEVDERDPAAEGDEQIVMDAALPISMGQELNGAIDPNDRLLFDGTYYDVWSYDGTAGEVLEVHLTSLQFDTYLIVGRLTDGEFVPMAENDDYEGSNSGLEIELPETDTYYLVANSYYAGDVGSYRLCVVQAPPPVDWSSAYPGGGDPDGRYALLVGIDDYPGIDDDLPSSVADTRLMQQLLVEHYGFRPHDIRVITDAEATREHIANAFLRHLGQAGPDGVAVFYYSGHGIQMDDNYGVTAPLDPENDEVDEAIYIWGKDERSSVILDDELGFLANQLKTERVLMVLDACYSGTGTRGGAFEKRVAYKDVADQLALPLKYLVDNTTLQAASASAMAANATTKTSGVSDLLMLSQRHLLLSASAQDETALAGVGDEATNGVLASIFTYYLYEALTAAQGDETFDQVMNPVRTKTRNYAQVLRGDAQTPQVEGRAAAMSIREFLGSR